MKTETIKRKTYRLPGQLSQFQKEMYVHLIDWKREKLGIKEPGIYNYQGRRIPYDAILPESAIKDYPIIYPEILDPLFEHQKYFPFKLHQHFNHMASSQAANVNLFLPVLLSPAVNEILKELKLDLKTLDTSQLFHGFQIEYWDGQGKEKGLLGDHNARSGTDSDIAIAYQNQDGEFCLWLIEHKLTETEFTTCGGAKSGNRDKSRHNCNKPLPSILLDKNSCYYHDVRKNNYWNITERHQSFFKNHPQFQGCPFIGGLNQLWRNQLLGLALEDEGRYKHVFFSVVYHPGNRALENSLKAYGELVNHNPKFSAFTSDTLVDIARSQKDKSLDKWVEWYEGMYKLQ